eukprot:TRINITY_DN2619_c0_g1_i4.p1 TRINITY_DN2619_c0_g1~~TRINITY_DN2619_c0_g1_i4.p1  ORF type:complete len:388 (-),score=117.31 TRINITY_DN2619_c0_g1_i4:51-1214(-)
MTSAPTTSGWPRNWNSVATNLFGEDRGFNYQGNDATPCRDPFNGGNSYTSAYPKAKYTPGQRVCLAWPAKNHKAESCTNAFIPDTQLSLFASPANPTGDITQTQYKQNVVAAELGGKHVNGQIDLKGFQNCPNFCGGQGTDKASCGQCFTVPSTFAVGSTYSFQWYWIFNEGSPPYTTCWEADIVDANGNTGNPTTTGNTPSNPTSNTGGSGASPTATQATPVISRPPLNGNSIYIVKAPVQTTLSGSFVVKVQYSATSSRVITVDMLDNKSGQVNWYGKGTATVQAGSGTVDITVTFMGTNKATMGKNLYFRAWLVAAEKFSDDESKQSWLYEDDVQDSDFVASNQVVYPAEGVSPSSTNIKGSNASSIQIQLVSFALIAVFLAFF